MVIKCSYNFMRLFVLILIFLGKLGFTEEKLDVERLPAFRTQQYSLDPYKKIVVFSAPRTGSSLIYNVFRFLFEDEQNLYRFHYQWDKNCRVLKTHKFSDVELLENEGDVLYVVTIRNPIQSIVSNYRVSAEYKANAKNFARKLMMMHKKYMIFYDKLKQNKDVIFIKFEDIEGNFEYLFDLIESRIGVSIAEADKELMKRGFAKQNIYEAVQNYSDFNEYLPISGFHGKHVILEEYEPPEELVYWLKYFSHDVQDLFSKYGYFLE